MKAMNTAAFVVLIGQLRSCYTHGKRDNSWKIPPPITKREYIRIDACLRVRGPFPTVRMPKGGAAVLTSGYQQRRVSCESHKTISSFMEAAAFECAASLETTAALFRRSLQCFE